MERTGRLVLRRVTVGTLVLAAVYAGLLMPWSRPTPGYSGWVDGWLNSVVDLGVVAVLVGRGLVDRRERAPWLLLGAGLAAALAGSVTYYVDQQFRAVPSPSWADVGWLGFYPLLYAGLVLMLLDRGSRVLRSLWLDGLLAGLAATAFALAFLPGAAVPFSGDGSWGLAAAYPVADLLLLALSAGALAILGRAADATWWLLSAAFACFAVTDALYAAEVAQASYVAGGLLDLGWLLARLLLVAAAWTSLRGPGASRPVRRHGVAVLLLPTVCAVSVLVLLFHGTRNELPRGASGLALAAGLVAVLRVALTFREVRDMAEVRRQALTDELTGLANRRHFYAALGRTHQVLVRRPCAVVVLDLDRFKEVNDSLGHQVGDELLRLVSRRLEGLLRVDDVAARLGGDEFAVLVPGASSEDARLLGLRVREQLQRPFAVHAATVVIDASIGVAAGPEHAATGPELMQMADVAMYTAKRQNRGVLVYEPARDSAGLHRLEVVAQLRAALGSGQVVVHYQPQFDLRRGRVVGVEALARWQHPVQGLLGPASFIELAESSGLMTPLTTLVLDDALRQCRQWCEGGLDLRVAVNISPSSLVDGDFPAQVQRLLSEHGVPAGSLVVEVTEELLMDSREGAVAALQRLRDGGVGVSVDDYGTGYSSLAYLQDLPVSELKLDRTFVANMAGSSRSAAIVQSTVALAHALDLEIVAEGVEDGVTLDLLRTVGCDLVQGYFLSRPVPSADLPRALGDVVAAAHRSTSSRPGLSPRL